MAKSRNTKQKAAVLAAVKRAHHHPDAKWIYGEVSREIPDISLGTVYRALASLSAEGLITEYRQADGPVLYDPNTKDHFHIRCSRCGRIEDVPSVRLPAETLEAIRKASGFATVDEVRIDFGGVCSHCLEETRVSSASNYPPGERSGHHE